MRTMMVATVAVGLLAGPGWGVINVKLTADGPTWGGLLAVVPGQTTTVHIWAQGTASGIFSLGGDVVASGPGLASANPGTMAFSFDFNPSGLFIPRYGTPGPDGGWVGFGTQRTDWMNPPPFPPPGLLDYAEICSYTLTVGVSWTWGPTTLTFVPRTVGGYKPVETDKTGVIGTITPLTLVVVPEPLTLALLISGGLMLARRRV